MNAREMIALRRQLHQYPEISLEEYRTQETIASRLKKAGCKVKHKNLENRGNRAS